MKMSFIALNVSLLLGFLVLCSVLADQAKKPLVETKLGKIKGKKDKFEGKNYEKYLGIPFGKPPVGEQRWEKPVAAEPWEPNTYNATEFSKHCTQFIAKFYNFVGMGSETSEDCLYLNVYVPGSVSEIGDEKLPVMFYVFGGGYVLGTGEMYQGHIMALHGKVIVVTFNYRVGTLGWLSTGDSALPGNYGLWDSKLALEWVKEHISSFGGDPDQITVYGQSAGAAITSHFMVSSQTNHLFKNAICFSGASSGYFGAVAQPLQLAMLLSNIFNCTPSNTQDIEDCLRSLDAETLDFFGAVAQMKLLNCNPTLLPTIDGDFLLKPTREAFQTEAGKHINFMTGSLQHDGAAFVLKNPLGRDKVMKNHSATSHESLYTHMNQWYGFLENRDEIIQRYMNHYPDMKSDDLTTRTKGTVHGMTEAWFGAASNWEGEVHSSFNRSATYQYLFKYRQSFLHGYPDWLEGSHMDDMYSVFGETFMEKFRKTILRRKYKKQDRAMSDNFMTLISNFAHTSNPNKGPNKPLSKWSQYDEKDKKYMEIAEKHTEKSFQEKSKDYAFQMETFNHFKYPPLPTFHQLHDKMTVSESDLDQLVEEFKRELSDIYQSYYEIERGVNSFKERRLAIIQAV